MATALNVSHGEFCIFQQTNNPHLLNYRYSSGENQEDGKESFKSKVRECVMKWRDKIYEKPNTADMHFLVICKN